MASQGASGSLVESLAEAEQLLVNRSGSSSCGNNSAVASEERDSIVEATAVIEHLERSSNIDTRSEVGSDGSGPRPRQTATSSLVSGDSSGDRVAAFQADETDPSKSSTLQLLQDTRAAKEEADARLLSAERMIEQLEVTKQKELEQMKEKIDDVQIDAAKSLLIQKRRLNQEMVVMKQQLLTSEQQEENAKEKKDVVVRCLASMQETHAKEISNLKVQIDPSQIAAKCEENVRVDLNNAHVENRAMLSELTELRMKMLEKEQARENEVSDLKTMLEVARLREETLEQEASVSSIPSCRSRLLTMVSGTRRKPLQSKAASGSLVGRLDAIEEDNDDLDSIPDSCGSAKFHVSNGDSDEEIVLETGDVVDEVVVDMVLRQNGKVKKVLKEQQQEVESLAATVAASDMSIQQLRDQLALSQSSLASTTRELDALRELFRSREAEEATARCGVQSKAEDDRQDKEAENDLLREQVATLKEANRIAYARIEDLKHALATEDKNHKRELDELREKLLRNMGSDQGSSMGGSDLDSVKDRLKNVEEEKNVLANALEWKEQQWKTQIETAQLEVEEQKRKREAETISFKSQIAELEAAARQALETRPPPPCPLPALERRPATLLGLLRCPVRGGAGGGGLQPAFGQELTWRVISEIAGAVALLCCMRDCKDCIIQQTTREASRIWGSALLHGKSLFSLANGPSSQQWLRKAIVGHQRMADVGQAVDGPAGFLIRDLGCEAFTSRSGETFDSAVTVAHFPAEPACGKLPAILIILEPQSRPGYAKAAKSQQPRDQMSSAHSSHSGRSVDRRGRGPRGTSREGTPGGSALRSRSAHSDVSLSSVSPSDSASNVLGIPGW